MCFGTFRNVTGDTAGGRHKKLLTIGWVYLVSLILKNRLSKSLSSRLLGTSHAPAGAARNTSVAVGALLRNSPNTTVKELDQAIADCYSLVKDSYCTINNSYGAINNFYSPIKECYRAIKEIDSLVKVSDRIVKELDSLIKDYYSPVKDFDGAVAEIERSRTPCHSAYTRLSLPVRRTRRD